MRSSLQSTAKLFAGVDASEFPWHQLRYLHLAMLRSWLAEHKAPSTCNRWLSAVRGVLTVAWKLGQISGELQRRTCAVKSVKGRRLPPGRSLSVSEICRLFQSGDGSQVSYRDLAVLVCLYGAGLRRAEVTTLDVGDFDPVGGQLRVMGKGNAERVGYLVTGAPQLLSHWLSVRASGCEQLPVDGGPLFLPMAKRGGFAPRRLSVEGVSGAVRRAQRRAGLAHFTPHDMRRSFVSHLLGVSVDLSTVQKLVGHSSPTTTASYDRRGDEKRAQAAQRLHVPVELEGNAT